MPFSHVDPAMLPDNFFSRIGEDWMLITAADSHGKVNTMTASWGSAGILWNKPVAICFIRPQRYTYGIVEDASTLSLSFFPAGEQREALRFCGTKSGRDFDKFAETGLTPVRSDGGTPYIEEANLVLICRKLYADDLRESAFTDADMLRHYPTKDYHRFYICEITDVLVREN